MDSLRPRSHMGETSSQNDSIVPAGTDISFCVLSQHFVLGYFHKIPTGHTEARQAPQGRSMQSYFVSHATSQDADVNPDA
jgi:hypothetical protein